MDTRKVLILATLLAALAAVYFVSERQAAKKTQRAEVSLAEGFDVGRAASITIKSPDSDAVALKKKTGGWTVAAGTQSYDADNATIATLLGQIVNMRSATVVSKNPKNFDAFEVSDSKAVEVKIEDAGGSVLAWVLLGKNGPDIFSTYVRARDAQTVYLVPGFLKNSADRELKDWRDKALFKLDPAGIVHYAVSGDKSLQLRKTNTAGWQAVCGGRVSDVPPQAAEPVIKGFAALAAVDFSDNSTQEAELDKPLRTITSVLTDGTERKLFLGADKNAFQQFVTTGEQQQVYVVEKSALDSLSPDCQELQGSGTAADNATAELK